ncbi:EamA family transporter [Ramlibacter sp. USB13]|uniref:EamA family transporter n=1 Tax=Ramlibacter cellulosilyticus TaxID=2764187 RepID=A0A923SAG6_9BURK|nr:DMT family transporter [Ramlibacter cellulosilyticus]MBC5782754.1 EamA family transporter [Ramlibacter cellulosilyticus]
MILTWPIALAVLFAALLHASWNALVKSGTDKAMDTAVMNLIGGAMAVPVVLVAGLPSAAAWPWLLGSAAIHVVYYALLTAAYRHGELALTYPLMRGVAPLLVALVSVAAFAEPLSTAGWTGVLGVCAGVLVLGLSRHGLESGRAVALALANAVVIAGYTVVDAHGVRASGTAAGYVATLFVLNAVPFGAVVLARRGWRPLAEHAVRRGPLTALGAAASLGSYGIALWAMTRAPVASVAALRETSVLFAALIGAWQLQERFTPRRALGTAAIVAGVAALRLG